MSIVGNAGQKPRLMLAAGDTQLPVEPSREISPLLRRSRGRLQPFRDQVDGSPALVLPLSVENRHIGSAIIIYKDEAAIDMERATAAASMAAAALDLARQMAALQFQAEEIAERARVREIQVSRNLLRGVIDSIPMGLALLDSAGGVLAANRALAERFGLDPAALVGMNYSAAIGPWEVSPAGQTFATSTATRIRRTMHQPDGAQVLLEITSFPLFDSDNRTRQVVEVWEDITERVSLQTQLVRAEKLAAIGQLAASIAHEVGNPLQAIQGFLSLFLEQCDPATPNRRFLELAEEEIERIVQVLARLRDLYRPRADVIAPVNLNDLIENVLLLTGKQMERHQVRVVRELNPHLPPVMCVSDQIKQVLLNLVLNAIDAMKDGGSLKVQTRAKRERGEVDAVEIIVADTGVGIAPEQLPHLFDGLHTTKERGMGLGLYTSKAIIERHMGRISVRSSPGEGTAFVLSLPIES
jgi:PAS domain S-box-containing protein